VLQDIALDDFSRDSVPGATITVGSTSVTTGCGRAIPDGFRAGGVATGHGYGGRVRSVRPEPAHQGARELVTIVVVRANTMFESGGFLMYLPPGAPRPSVEFSCTSTATRTTAARSFADSFGSIRATSR
jgi:hypothetical protein